MISVPPARLIVALVVPAPPMRMMLPVTVVVLSTTLMVTAVAGAMCGAAETWVAPSGRHVVYLGAAGLRAPDDRLDPDQDVRPVRRCRCPVIPAASAGVQDHGHANRAP